MARGLSGVVKTLDLSGVPDVVFLNVNLQHVYVAVGVPGVIDVIDAENCQHMATVKTDPVHTRAGSMPHATPSLRFCRSRTPRPCTGRGP